MGKSGAGIFSIGLGLSPTLWVFFGFMFLVGCAVPAFSTPSMTVLQETVEPDRQGRVFGFFGIVSALWTHLHTVNYYALGLALTTLLVLLGWPAGTARAAVEHVCGTLTRVGNRHTAYETLRRDKHARALLDMPGRTWAVLLRALLGSPAAELATTGAGRGILLRLLIGETLPVLLRDDDLVLTLSLAAPGTNARGTDTSRGAR